MISLFFSKLGADEKRNGGFSTTLLLRRIMYIFLIFWVLVMMSAALFGDSLNEHLELASFMLYACGTMEASFQAKRYIETRVPPAYAYKTNKTAAKRIKRRQ